MRSESIMMDLILQTAVKSPDVRAVIMNGSRVNPNARKDPFQDYDLVYLVPEVEPYRRNSAIPPTFGEIMILQLPDDMIEPPPGDQRSYAYLMQFMDGTRIDLTFAPLEDASLYVEDTLSVVLLDKDNRFPPLPPPSDRGYLPSLPTAKAFDDCCNEFWWLNPYVAKGLWRGELTYARYMLDTHMRDMLMKMLTWYFGMQTCWEKSPGKLGKYLRPGIGEEFWHLLEQTYADADPEHTWQALFTMDELFRRAATAVAGKFGLHYPGGDDERVSTFIQTIHQLPPDATEIKMS